MSSLGDITNTVKKVGVIMDASKKIVLEANSEKTEYILMTHHQNADRDHNIKTTIEIVNMWQSSKILE
jgi:putative NIF3 family GTP cyclohydrolase 1 type 2